MIDNPFTRYAVLWIGMAFLMMGLQPLSAQAEWMVSLYGGIAHTFDSDVKLDQIADTHLDFHDVSWDDDSFKEPQYFGLRLTYWLSRQSPWGLAIDFAHAKMIAELDEGVSVTGRRDGELVDARERLGDSFVIFEFSHGHNLLTANILYRWLPQRRPAWFGRLQPYIGLGAGVAIPHVEVQASDPFATANYQFAGPVVQGLAGLNLDLMKHLSIFTEMRLSYAHLDIDLRGGGSLETNAWTYHFNIGFALRT